MKNNAQKSILDVDLNSDSSEDEDYIPDKKQ